MITLVNMPKKECGTQWTGASLKIIIMGNLSKKEGQKPIEVLHVRVVWQKIRASFFLTTLYDIIFK